jgi:hypothetical protein
VPALSAFATWAIAGAAPSLRSFRFATMAWRDRDLEVENPGRDARSVVELSRPRHLAEHASTEIQACGTDDLFIVPLANEAEACRRHA